MAIGTLAAGVTLLSWRRPVDACSPAMSAYAATTLLLGAHMVPHAAQAIVLRRMLPGLAGGLTVSLPSSALVVGLDADADDHLVKPFSFAELGAVMSRYERQVETGRSSKWSQYRRRFP